MPVNLGSEEREVLNGAGFGSITLFFLNSSMPSAHVYTLSAMMEVGEVSVTRQKIYFIILFMR
jgi:hypothetical protein